MPIRSALIIFAREPKLGKVKTRLAKELPVIDVLRLYKAFVRDVLGLALTIKCDRHFIYYAGHGSSIPFLRQFKNNFQFKRQMGKDLGDRMHRAFCYCKKIKFDRVIIIGTDCLTISKEEVNQAFEKLEHFDCVLGPSKDGGYYLIALNEPSSILFQGIHWGTRSVLDQTLQRARQFKKSVFLLKEREDIDALVHLKKFARNKKNISKAKHTQKLIKKISIHNI